MSAHPLRQAAQFLLGVPTEGIDPTLDRMLELAQSTPLCFVAVTGPDAAEAMGQLWRRGYQRVEIARRATCSAADERNDVLLVVGCPTADDMRATAASTLGLLRPGGVMVIDVSAVVDAEERLSLCEGLAQLGLDVQPQAHLAAEILATRRWGWRKAA
ncbi:hypothetical protein DMC25_13635 [Caulobacter sp. D4A]|uniref:hypothetical protein n=1 Tax=unclassified Caulobacter TaxID=2648921 RepID=UPI000D738C6B|nr:MULTISPECIES: hypothetical protein [unclassified Caulobacter]PXA86687.1 hypothetical protein DMC25_13635 [Caulobacter sp. D4A]PXA88518.1 hypothetical protein DMC18_19085 [Caulobacter sp. D5]